MTQLSTQLHAIPISAPPQSHPPTHSPAHSRTSVHWFMWWSSPQLKHLMAILLSRCASLLTHLSAQKGSWYTCSKLPMLESRSNQPVGNMEVLGCGIFELLPDDRFVTKSGQKAALIWYDRNQVTTDLKGQYGSPNYTTSVNRGNSLLKMDGFLYRHRL